MKRLLARWHQCRVGGDDRGATLVLVLVLVTVMAVGLAALLTMADTSVRATIGLRDQSGSAADADGATEAAVNTIRNSSFAGDGPCFGASSRLQLHDFGGTGRSATVTCSADPSRVLIQCPSLSNCNRPGSAILTLGSVPGEDGLNVKDLTGSGLKVHGTVFSNSGIDVENGKLISNNKVYARGACSGSITSVPAPATCNYGATPNALGNDPNYAPDLATAPAYRPMSGAGSPGAQCTAKGPNSVISFDPGYYDDAAALSAMMAGNSACKHSTWWFKPGAYYFDFHNADANANPLLGSGPNLWTIDDGYLVAGTPVNAAGATIASPPVPAAIPGSCANPILSASAVGVQFVFGGSSQFAVKAGQAEICGSYHVNRPPVAVYGLKSGAETTTPVSLTPAAVPNAGGYTSATSAALSTADGTAATWKSAKTNDSTTLTMTGFAPATAIPAGSVLQSAKLKLTHRHASTSSSDNLTAVVTPSGGTAVTGAAAVSLTGGTTFQAQTIDLDLARTDAIAKAVHDGTFTGATVALTTKLPANKDTEDLDAVSLELTYTAPALRAGSGCVTGTPYLGGGSSSCALISTINNSGNQFYVQGTTYAPKAAIDLTLNNAAEQVFRFGVVSRVLWLKLTGSFTYSGPVIEVPDDSPGFAVSVYLSTFVCSGSGDCPTTGEPAIRSRVAYVDADPGAPAPGHRQVVVLSWSSRR
ncbi:hypothetical protein [Labedaea rhizosphaerae]|uniref:Tfp pilus assembly protein PilX n=1 Tax=Labedaea rhizosphaerae TaxID=598644 RepID=A0A4R6SA11_LABRH|nr:hypothetical protein [Labedaea rhizosphaerae]TDP96772.1 hypothetical protein EV186_104760 [Labedaea rhizosphaerae]